MHSLSPYLLRCFNPQLPGKLEERYSILDKIGQSDTFQLLKQYIESKSNKFYIIEETEQVIRFEDMTFNEDTRVICGWFKVGHYGTKTDIINISTGDVDFEKAQNNAEIIRHFIYFFLPKGFNESIALIHAYRGNGVKTIFYELFKPFFHEKTNLVFQMNPLSYDKAFEEWKNANAKEIRLVKFEGLADKADAIKNLGHQEMELKLKPPRRGTLGKLKDYFDVTSEQSKAIEILTPLCASIRTVVELDGRKRIFTIGVAASHFLCEIEAPEDLALTDGNPEFEAMKKWCFEITKEFAEAMYPDLEVLP